MEWFKKNLANMITTLRIMGAVALLFFKPLSLPFLIIYASCGVTDVLDGIIARSLHTQSRVGSILDSLADIIFYVILAIKIVPVMEGLLHLESWIIIFTAVIFHVTAYVICAFKFKKFSALHTYANKAMSFVIFCFPFSLIGGHEWVYTIYTYVGGAVAIYSAIEMCLIHIIAKQYDIRNKSIFLIKRNENNPQEEEIEK